MQPKFRSVSSAELHLKVRLNEARSKKPGSKKPAEIFSLAPSALYDLVDASFERMASPIVAVEEVLVVCLY
jgi:hypothetical protein